MSTTSVTFRCPDALLARIDREAERRGRTRTEHILELLDAEGGDLSSRLRAIERKLGSMAHVLEAKLP